EIGVRMALGAERSHVLRLVLGQGVRLAAIGVVLGLIGAFGVTRYLKTILYNVTPTDLVSFAGVAGFLTLVAIIASYVPARRAMAVDPLIALRNEERRAFRKRSRFRRVRSPTRLAGRPFLPARPSGLLACHNVMPAP